MRLILLSALTLLQPVSLSAVAEGVTTVRDSAELRRAIGTARPGDRIRLAPGDYRPDVSARGLKGTKEKPIRIEAADPSRPPVFKGGSAALHLVSVEFVTISDLVIVGASGNGLNIDDGGNPGRPTRGVILERIKVRDIGPKGNHDGIKLSGLIDFQVRDCLIERWGSGGSGIDMVGCRGGEIVGCIFRHGDRDGDNGVQAKGGSSDIAIRRCRFEHSGQRGVNLGGSTGLNYFRPRPEGFEARNLIVEDCTFIGSLAPVAFVGIDGSTVRHNTFYRPGRWAIRILQETRDPSFVPSRRGVFTDNLVVFRSGEVVEAVNVGPATDPSSFTFARNAWYCLDAPSRSRVRLPATETEGTYGVAPIFKAAEEGNLEQVEKSPLAARGVRPSR